MGGVCAEQHKFHPAYQILLKKSLREIDIPPRKLLGGRRAAASFSPEIAEMYSDSPRSEEAMMQKFLPYNNACDDDDDDSGDPYSSDHFRMYDFKVRRCTRSRSHDWTDCPFAHPGEKARRRDPRRYHYSGTVCSDFRRGSCNRGENCEFSHGVFECWLHPSRYRTEACKDGKNCKRKVCFFAHTPRQLRLLPSNCHENSTSISSPMTVSERKFPNSNNCCVHCHSVINSPTSTLLGISHLSPPMSPPSSFSPPLSPVKSRSVSGFSPISMYNDKINLGVLSYKEALTELMSSMEAMNVSEGFYTPSRRNFSWVDVNFNGEDQPQFVLSPSTPSSSGFRDFFSNGESSRKNFIDKQQSDNGLACPDLGWVNDLLT